MIIAEKLLSTGLPLLDKELDGGLHPGSLIYLRADPMAMAEIFLYYFLQKTPTYYVNTERKPEFILLNMQRLGFETADIKFIDVHKKYYEKEGKLLYSKEVKDYMILDYLKKQLETIKDTGVNLCVDTITFFLYLGVKRALIIELIDTIYNTTKKTKGLGFLYGLKEEPCAPNENEIINHCDVIFDVSMVRKADRVVTELIIPKARDRPIRGNVLKFRIEGGIIMDTSREIA